jgi:hypothetical protein
LADQRRPRRQFLSDLLQIKRGDRPR